VRSATVVPPSISNARFSGRKARFQVLALISVGTMINYLDRSVLGIAAPHMAAEMHITPATMGIIFSVFSWSYVAAQIPGGWILDQMGIRTTYFLAVACWSLFTLAQSAVTNIYSLIACLCGLGICEAPCFPTNARVVSEWFREPERARATAIYTVGEYLGPAIIGPLLFWISGMFGWRSLFFTVGIAGLVFALTWFKLYRDSEITCDSVSLRLHAPIRWDRVGQLLCKRQLWGAGIGQFAANSTMVFFLTWFPMYLTKERHIEWMHAGIVAIVPFIAAAGGILFAGWLSDTILRRTRSASLARKLPIMLGLFGASTIVVANYVKGNSEVLAILSFAFFCQGMTGLCWALVSDIAPEGLSGITGGIFNLTANLGGVITPIVIGAIIEATGSFVYALGFVGGIALLGALSYLLILGKVERIVIECRA
jgi:MFS transporter, ACS family, D-galactonate transporter